MEKREILEKLVEHYAGGNKARFARMIGVEPQLISAWVRRNSFDIDKVSTNCIGINPHFLLNGDGPITLEDENDETMPTCTENEGVVLMDELVELAQELKDERVCARKDVEDAKEILRKSQEQFDRVLSLAEHLCKNKDDEEMEAEAEAEAEDEKAAYQNL